MLEEATESAAKAAQDALLKELEAEGAEASSGPSSGKRTGSAAGSTAAALKHQQHQHQQQHKHAAAGVGQHPTIGAAPEGDSEEARKAREELERKRRCVLAVVLLTLLRVPTMWLRYVCDCPCILL